MKIKHKAIIIILLAIIGNIYATKVENKTAKDNTKTSKSKKTIIDSANKKYISFLRDTLKYGTPNQIIAQIRKISKKPDNKYAFFLLEALKMSNVNVKKEAARVLAILKSKQAFDILKENLKESKDDNLTLNLLSALGNLKDKRSEDIVLPYIDSKNIAIRELAIKILGDISSKAVLPKLYDIIKNEDSPQTVVSAAIVALGNIKDKQNISILTNVLFDEYANKYHRMFSATSLGRLGFDEVIPILKDAMEKIRDERIRRRCILALFSIKSSKVNDIIIKSMRSDVSAIRRAAVKEAGDRKLKEALPYLEYRKDYDSDPTIKKLAKESINKINGKQKKKPPTKGSSK